MKRYHKLQEFPAHLSNANCLKIGRKSPEVLVTGGEDKTVNVWTIGKSIPVLTLTGHQSPIDCVSFAPTEDVVVAGATNGIVKLWDLEQAKVTRTLPGHSANCWCVDFHPDGVCLASGSLDTDVKIWDTRRRMCLSTLKGHNTGVTHVQFSPDGKWLASGSKNGEVKLWNIEGGKLYHNFKRHNSAVTGLEFNTKEYILATWSSDCTLRMWNLDKLDTIDMAGGNCPGVCSAMFHPDGQHFIAAVPDALRVWSWEPAVECDNIPVEWSRVVDISMMPSNDELVACSFNHNTVGIWSIDLNMVNPWCISQDVSALQNGSAPSHVSGCAPRHLRTATVDGQAGEYDEFAVESSLDSSTSSDSQPHTLEVQPPPPVQRPSDPEYEVPQGRLTETQVMQLYNIRNLDRYGFVADVQHPIPTPAELEKNARRVRKWQRMLGPNGAGWKLYFDRKPDKVKRRIRKGIPIEFRGLAWQLLSGGRDLMIGNPGLYRALIESANGDYEQMIMRDLNRTFPNHIKFIGRQGPGQRDLYHVLLAYAAYDKKVGYVQGMGFITAVLLIFMPEEEAFWTLVALMKGTTLSPLEELFVPEMPLLKQYLYQLEHLIKQDSPRLSQHFDEEGIYLSMFCTHWFNTVFAYMLPFEHLLRVWDIFLLEGIKVVFRVGLALLKSSEKDFIQMKFETLVAALQSKKYPILARPPEELLKVALRISVSKRLEVLKEHYLKQEQPVFA